MVKGKEGRRYARRRTSRLNGASILPDRGNAPPVRLCGSQSPDQCLLQVVQGAAIQGQGRLQPLVEPLDQPDRLRRVQPPPEQPLSLGKQLMRRAGKNAPPLRQDEQAIRMA